MALIVAMEHDSPNKCRGYDTQQSHDEASIMLEIWGMQATLMPLLPDPL